LTRKFTIKFMKLYVDSINLIVNLQKKKKNNNVQKNDTKQISI
jgi:hypothetical protein